MSIELNGSKMSAAMTVTLIPHATEKFSAMTPTMSGAVTKPARDNQLIVATPVAGRIPGR